MPANFLVVMSDEHDPKVAGYAGHPIISTPNLDALAARGTVFRNAYTTRPVCIPARAGFACGKYTHQIGFRDNADAYDGSVAWHHALRSRGHRVVSAGKLHFRLPGEDHGFSDPMHIIDGKGDLMAWCAKTCRGAAARKRWRPWQAGANRPIDFPNALHIPKSAADGEDDMPRAIASGHTLGATIEGLNLAQPLSEEEFEFAMGALGEHGVLRFPGQELTAQQLKDFSARFGELEINVANSYQEPGLPEVMILSNIVENGKPLGLADAGQSWHTDMSYSRLIAFCNVLYGIKIPHRNGQPLGNTEFCDQRAAYDELPADLKRTLEGKTALHDFNKFWEMMRREKGSTRPPLTEAQRQAKPPVSQPVFLTHPITGRKGLYANPGYTMRINELPQKESGEILEVLFEHQTQPRFRYAARWHVGDVLMWDNMRTIHNAVADYRPDEPRLIKRCQVMATRFFTETA